MPPYNTENHSKYPNIPPGVIQLPQTQFLLNRFSCASKPVSRTAMVATLFPIGQSRNSHIPAKVFPTHPRLFPRFGSSIGLNKLSGNF